ncbi:MAG TPA: hypothetical protein VMS31_21015 [Pyrinomonadaceae bacterium]|nr:hypothetical protein [Pyrinomonadaceae bacterium]
MKTNSLFYILITLLLRAGLVVALISAGWGIYNQLPYRSLASPPTASGATTLQIVLRPAPGVAALDIPIELYPVDIVAARHEYFTERRAGKRFDDFLSERMKGRSPITARLDKRGQTAVEVNPGSWWVHALASGEEDLEWRLPVNVAGRHQTVELTSQNVYTRTRSF